MSEPEIPRPAADRQPSAATRFKPGQSGNPKGRPRGSRNFSTAIEKELNCTVVVNENGKRKKITKRDAAAKQLVNKAVTGDLRALAALMNEVCRQEIAEHPAAAACAIVSVTPDDQDVMANIVRRIREMTPVPLIPSEAVVKGRGMMILPPAAGSDPEMSPEPHDGK